MSEARRRGTSETGKDPGLVNTLIQLMSGTGSLPRPTEAMNPLIDATERAVIRYGLQRTTMSNLAREMNVARTTLYRQIDSVEDAFVLAIGRTVYTFLDELVAAVLSGHAWSQMFIDAAVRAVALRQERPLLRHVLESEPELLGEFMSDQRGLPRLIARMAELAAPVLETAMSAGQLRHTDPQLAAEGLANTIVILILCPPAGDVRARVEYMLSPMLNDSYGAQVH
ncbi:TetR/AcrR family transcriptional regulator [Nocardia sp. NPDC055321]